MKTPNAFDLADMLRGFYPPGIGQRFPLTIEGYHKFPKVIKVIEEKIQKIKTEKGTRPWIGFTEKIEAVFNKNQIKNFSYLQSPDLFLKIQLEEKNCDGFMWRKNICVGISLLLPYFTVFFETEMGTDRFVSEKERNGFEFMARANFPRKVIAFGQKNASKTENELLEKVKYILRDSYPKHTFLSPYRVLKRNLYSENEMDQIDLIGFRFSKYLFGSYEYLLFDQDGFEVFE